MTDTLLIDFTEALGCCRGVLPPTELGRVIANTALRWGSPTEVGINIASITYKPAEGFTGRPRRCVVLVNPRLEPLYRVERIEALQRVILRVWQYYADRTDFGTKPMYDALGVWQSPLLDTRTRWHHLGQKYHEGRVSASKFEDRPVCPICHIHVSTGHTNPRIHDGCREYVRTVYAPAINAQRKEQSNATA
jgi:hypothetical protein